MFFDRRLWQFTAGLRFRIAAAAGVGLLATVAGIARLALMGWLLAGIFEGWSAADLMLPIAVVAGVMVLRGGLEYWRTMIAHNTAMLVQGRLRGVLFDRIVALGPAHFGLRRTGDVMTAMVDGVEQLEVYFGQFLPQLFVAAITPPAIFVFVAFLDLPVAGVLVGFAVVTLIAPAAFNALDRKASLGRKQAYGAYAAEFLDALQGLATLKAFGQSGARARALADKAQELFRATMRVLAFNTLSRGITDTGVAVGAAATLALGAVRVANGDMSLAALLVILMLGIEVFRPLRDLRTLLHAGMMGRAAAHGLYDILDAKPSIEDTAAAADGGPLAPTVAFDGVGFAYPGAGHDAHTDLSFTAEAGARIGVVGASGCGKSTIVKLLLRLYDPQAGCVRLGGHDVRSLPLAQLRGQIAVVNQDTYLFHGTVEDNLRFGKPDASAAEVRAAARAANVDSFVDALPQGYGTVVGERGVRLSGGQRQRIAIARALLRDAPILILDEALSSVDAENEATIQAALDRLMAGRTTLILAHRLSSIIAADRILVLDRGRVVETGPHASLMAGGGVYHRLMARQAADESDVDARLFDAPVGSSVEQPAAPDLLTHADIGAAPGSEILSARGLGWLGVLGRLLRLVAPWRLRLVVTFLLGIARVAAFIGVGVVSGLVVAAVKNGAPVDTLLIVLAVVAPLAGILHWFESWAAHDMAYRLLTVLRIAMFRKLERLAPAYLLQRRSGDLVSVATQDVETIEYFFAHTITPAFVAVLVPAVVLAVLVAFGWPMAVALAPFLALVVFSPVAMRRRIDTLGARAREVLGELNAFAADTLQGLTEVVAFQRAPEWRARLMAQVDDYRRIRLPLLRDLTLQMALLEVATGLGGLAVIGAGAVAVGRGMLDPGLLPMLTLLAMAAFLPVSEIANVGRQLADTLGATRRLDSVIREPIPVVDGPGVAGPVATGSAPAPRARAPTLQLAGVDFAYPNATRLALSGVSLDVDAGTTVALVGRSGAGKTTVAHLLMRFWDPRAGVVRMNGHDLRAYGLDALRGRIALVTQDTYLFNDSLRANVLLARPEASDEDLQDALGHSALADFVAALPDGLDTIVGERGMRLSGGQRQRVAIARAFLKDAPILILDEATSHLDAISERAVYAALDALMSARTTVVIAHRLSTVRNADQIVVMDEGRAVERGSHAELVVRGGLYARLVARQLAGTVGTAAE